MSVADFFMRALTGAPKPPKEEPEKPQKLPEKGVRKQLKPPPKPPEDPFEGKDYYQLLKEDKKKVFDAILADKKIDKKLKDLALSDALISGEEEFILYYSRKSGVSWLYESLKNPMLSSQAALVLTDLLPRLPRMLTPYGAPFLDDFIDAGRFDDLKKWKEKTIFMGFNKMQLRKLLRKGLLDLIPEEDREDPNLLRALEEKPLKPQSLLEKTLDEIKKGKKSDIDEILQAFDEGQADPREYLETPDGIFTWIEVATMLDSPEILDYLTENDFSSHWLPALKKAAEQDHLKAFLVIWSRVGRLPKELEPYARKHAEVAAAYHFFRSPLQGDFIDSCQKDVDALLKSLSLRNNNFLETILPKKTSRIVVAVAAAQVISSPEWTRKLTACLRRYNYTPTLFFFDWIQLEDIHLEALALFSEKLKIPPESFGLSDRVQKKLREQLRLRAEVRQRKRNLSQIDPSIKDLDAFKKALSRKKSISR